MCAQKKKSKGLKVLHYYKGHETRTCFHPSKSRRTPGLAIKHPYIHNISIKLFMSWSVRVEST